MQKIILFVLIFVIVISCNKSHQVLVAEPPGSTQNAINILSDAYKHKKSDIQIQGQGIVDRVLSDDVSGSQHQRFILKLSSGQKLLVAHNIDLAPKVNDLAVGDTVAFYGEYEWNNKGGVIHWTHHDPSNRHAGGWLKHNGKIYQ